MSDEKPKRSIREPGYDPVLVADVSEAVYRMRLGGDEAAARMIADDKDSGEKLRGRARAYDSLTRAYLKVLKHSGELS